MQRGKGPYLIDVEDREYIDYVCSWGAALLGHAHPDVVQATSQAAQDGIGFGAPTILEIKLAEQIRKCLPTMECMRFVNSGTEAVMSAIRLARGWTKRRR